MVIESTCTGLSCRAIQRYNWILYMLDPWAVNETWLQVTDLDERILTNLDSPTLVFKGRFLRQLLLGTLISKKVVVPEYFSRQ